MDLTPGPTDETEAAAPGVEDGPALDLDALASELAEVEAALARLDDGSYGRCVACPAPIDDDLLAADPTARACAAHLLV